MTKNIIKRIIVAVAVALVLALLKKGHFLMEVQAKSISTHKAPFESFTFNSTQDKFTTTIDNPFFTNAGVGYLYFTFSLNKSSGNATATISMIRQVVVFSGSTGYVCDIGTSSLQNSTYGGISYSARCPINISSSGITKIVYYITDLQANDLSLYRWVNEGYYSFESDSSVTVNVDTSSTTSAINNQTTTITNNANQNTQAIKDEIKEQLNDCRNSKNLAKVATVTTNNFWLTDLLSAGTYTLSWKGTTSPSFNIKKGSAGSTIITITSGSSATFYLDDGAALYFNGWGNNNTSMYELQLEKGSTPTAYEPYGVPVCSNKIDKVDSSINNVNSSINNINNTITNTNTTQANGFFDDYIEDFDPNTHGLTRIVLAPLQLVSSLLDTSCSSLTLPLPFVNQNITIPCMSSVYTTYFPTFLVIYRLITDGVISYWVCVNVFRKVKGFLDPTDDKVEVFDL